MENLLAVSLRLHGVVAGFMVMVGGAYYAFLDEIFGNSMTGRNCWQRNGFFPSFI